MYLRIICCVVTILLNFMRVQALESRIVGGAISTTAIPYQIALYINGNFACGGSLITNKCVLTAGHCAKGRAATAFKVRAGIMKLSSTGGVTRTVSQAFVSSNFSLSTLNYDVAILKLSSAVSGTDIGTIPLNTVSMYANDQLTVSGWGLTSEGGSVSDDLRYVTVPALSKTTCTAEYPNMITNTMFCAASSGKDSCSGDSGGPVVKDGHQYGIVSWGNGCAEAGYAGVYTSVKQVSSYINNIMKLNCM